MGVQQQSAAETFGEAHLFFSARNNGEVLHAGLFKTALDESVLTKYDVSLSRQPEMEKRYVTDALCSQNIDLWRLIQMPDCHYYICGDGRMADAAYDALLLAITKGGHMSRAKAVVFMDSMRAQGRYHLDVWGVIKT